MRRNLTAALIFIALPASAQTDVVSAGVVGDNAIVAPVIRWQHELKSEDVASLSLNGWQISAGWERRRRGYSWTGAALVTPIHARSSNRIYRLGQRQRDAEFDDASVELNWGRADRLNDRWTSDIRGVLLFENVSGVDAATADVWSRPYAGARMVQTYRRVTAEDPFLFRWQGWMASATAEALFGSRTWSRMTLTEQVRRPIGRWVAGESVTVFTGKSLNLVNRFLVGGSWPVEGLHALYGYRYGEFRIERGVSATIDAERGAFAVHASTLRAPGLRAHGIAADFSKRWRGIGIRVGAAVPLQHGRHGSRLIAYGSVVGASFR
jgi:hypothetical protein